MTTEILILSLIFLFAINTPIAIAIGVASILAILVQGDFSMMMVRCEVPRQRIMALVLR